MYRLYLEHAKQRSTIITLFVEVKLKKNKAVPVQA